MFFSVALLLVAACDASKHAGEHRSVRPVGTVTRPHRVAKTARSRPVRARVVLEHADAWLGRDIVVDIYERLFDSAHTSAAKWNEVEIEVQDVGTATLCLASARREAEVEAGVLRVLPRELEPPIRVRGTLVRATRREARSGRITRLILVHAIEPLEWPVSQVLSSLQAVLDEPRRWDGRYVTVEGAVYAGFEASYFGSTDDPVWLDFYDDALGCAVPDCGFRGAVVGQLRVTGFVYTRGRYGHLGGSAALIQATRATCLDKAIECAP